MSKYSRNTNEKNVRMRRFRSGILSVCVTFVMLAVFVWTAGFIFSTESIDDNVDYPSDKSKPLYIAGNDESKTTEKETSSVTAETETEVTTTTTSAETEPVTTEPPETEPVTEAVTEPAETEPVVEEYDFSKPVPEREKVSDDFFTDAVFIGDSRTVGLSMHSGLKAIYYGYTGLNISSVDTQYFIKSTDENGNEIDLTVMQALEHNTDYSKVYISLGLNELGWNSSEIFAQVYSNVVSRIKELRPDVQIYVQGIIPMTEQASNTNYKDTGNPRIREFNALLEKMCEEQQVYYLDLYSYFADENDALPADAAKDGVHFSREYYIKWADYLRTHTVPVSNE